MLFSQIKEDLMTAMKAGDAVTKDTLRFLIAEVKNEAVNSGTDRENPSDEVVAAVLDKAVKRRNESIRVYKESNREDLVKTEEEQLDVLKKYLPEQLSDDELKAIVDKIKTENPTVQGMALMGKIMPFVKGKVDPEKVKSLVLGQ